MPTMSHADQVRNFQAIIKHRTERGVSESDARAEAIRLCGTRFANVPTGVLLFTAPTAPAPKPVVVAPPKPKDREAVYSELEAAAFAERRPGQTDQAAVADFLATERGARMYAEYRDAPSPELPPAQVAVRPVSDHVFAAHQAEAERLYPGLTREGATARYYDEHPAAYQHYRAAVDTERRRG